jgi:N-acetylglutamate synthase-like GNAT family acetyltransferase
MQLVDLKGRQDEPRALRILERSHASIEALDVVRTRYATGEWMFLGLEEDEDIVACAGAERLDDRTIGIRSIAVDPSWRHLGMGRTLLGALGEQLDAERIVAETDDDAVEFYRRCGFTVTDTTPKFGRARYWCVRDYAPATRPGSVTLRPDSDR